jgi:WD40 repeat protein/serine/threonine protein kinase
MPPDLDELLEHAGEDVIDRFERAWREAREGPEIERCLEPLDARRHQLLVDLAHIDLEYRLKSGQPARVEEYLARFAALRSDDAATASLIQSEYRLRCRAEPGLSADEYRRRFPALSVRMFEEGDGPGERFVSASRIATEPLGPLDTSRSVARCPQGSSADVPQAVAGADPPAHIADYELLEEVGRGGMGVVYRARQRSLNREVAVKTIRAGVLATEEQIARFRREARVAGRMDHPNIIQLYEMGQDAGRHFFSMTYVRGRGLDRIIGRAPLDRRRAAALTMKTARAVHYAHQQGVLHRDLKPSNIVVGVDDEPHVMDFGLAVRVDLGGQDGPAGDGTPAGLTQAGQLLGTPSYLPPEQICGEPATVSGDIYGLGAVLYEALTGRPPFEAATAWETLQLAVAHEPVPPRALNPGIDRDLETICLKCLQKGASDRYATAEQLADDLERYLAGRPIAARPVSRFESTRRWSRRNPLATALIAAILCGLLLVAAGSLFAAVSIEEARRKAQSLADDLARLAAGSLIESGARDAEQGRVRSAVTRFARAYELAERDPPLRTASGNLLRHHASAVDTTLVHDSPVRSLAFSPGSTHLAAICHDGQIGLWDVPDARAPRVWRGHAYAGQSVAFAADGGRFATCAEDGTVCVWRVADAAREGPVLRHGQAVLAIQFLDQRRLVTGCQDGVARIWDWRAGETVREMRHTHGVQCLAVSSDGRRLVSGCQDGHVALWNVRDGSRLRDFPGHRDAIRCLALRADGKYILSGSADFTARRWDVATGEFLEVRTSVFVNAVAFQPGDRRFLVAGRDHRVRLVDGEGGQTVLSHDDAVLDACFSPDGRFIASCSEDGTARIWDAQTGQPVGQPIRHEYYVNKVGFSPDGKYLATGGLDGLVCLRQVPAPRSELILPHAGEVWVAALSPDLTDKAERARVLTAGRDNSARLWDGSGRPIAEIGFGDWVMCGAWSSDGGLFAAGGFDGAVKIGAAATGRVMHVLDHRPAEDRPAEADKAPPRPRGFEIVAIAFSQDRRTLATMNYAGDVWLWDVRSGQRRHERPLRRPEETPRPVSMDRTWLESVHAQCQLRFDHAGRRLLACHYDRGVQVWKVSDVEEVAVRLEDPRSPEPVRSLDAVFSPDGSRIATCQSGIGAPSVRLWSARDSRPLGEVMTMRLNTGVHALAFGPAGRCLAVAATDGFIYVWNLSNFRLAADPLPQCPGTHVRCLAFSPDGQVLAAAGLDGAVKLWDTTTWRWLGWTLRHQGAVVGVSFSRDGRRLISASADGTARIVDLPDPPAVPPALVPAWSEVRTGTRWDTENVRIRTSTFDEWRQSRAILPPADP